MQRVLTVWIALICCWMVGGIASGTPVRMLQPAGCSLPPGQGCNKEEENVPSTKPTVPITRVPTPLTGDNTPTIFKEEEEEQEQGKISSASSVFSDENIVYFAIGGGALVLVAAACLFKRRRDTSRSRDAVKPFGLEKRELQNYGKAAPSNASSSAYPVASTYESYASEQPEHENYIQPYDSNTWGTRWLKDKSFRMPAFQSIREKANSFRQNHRNVHKQRSSESTINPRKSPKQQAVSFSGKIKLESQQGKKQARGLRNNVERDLDGVPVRISGLI